MIGSLSAASRLFESCLRQPAHTQINICHWWELPTVAVFCGNVLIWNKTSNLKWKKKKRLFVVSSSLLTSCLFGNKCKEFHYTRWHLFRINLRFVWGRLPINRARTSSLNPSRPLCSESRKLFFSFFKLASLTHAAEERTDSRCHKALTWAGKQTGT